jgi:putative PIN family toxin of toxin-antitoxin system
VHTYKVFIDTNVWFSFFYGSKTSEDIIKKHIDGKIQVVISKDVLDELVKNVVQKIPRLEKDLLNFFEAFPPEIVKSPTKIENSVKDYVHFKDRHIFQACLDSECELFVTGNLKDFKVREIYERYKIKVISPREVIGILPG